MKQWPKLHRAIELRDELNLWSVEGMGTIDYESSDNLHDSSDPIVWIEYRAQSDTLPDEMRGAMLLGDMIHNFRAALDHQMWAVTPPAARAGGNGRQVQFPIHTLTRKWEAWRKRWGGHYGDKVLAVLHAAQPCNLDTQEARSHALELLQSLSNMDKHRALNVTARVAHDGYPFRITPEPAGGVRVARHAGPIGTDTILARAEWDREEDVSGEVEVAPTIAYDQQVFIPDLDSDDERAGEWHPLGDLVNAISSQVVLYVGALYNADRVDHGLPQDK
ncbi:MAG: hypothetical protein K4304_06425 [Propionicimonas sp.]